MKKDYRSHILAVSSSYVKDLKTFTDADNKELPFVSDSIWFGPRNLLEQDSNFKQIIPYIIIEQNGKYLHYQRTPKGGEKRLHGSYSIGFGGHIDIGDVVTQNNNQEIDLLNTIIIAAKRELFEELNLSIERDTKNKEFSILGYIMDEDPTNAVSQVHLGIVLLVSLKDNIVVASPENQIDLKGFETIDKLAHSIDNYETWSREMIRDLNSTDI